MLDTPQENENIEKQTKKVYSRKITQLAKYMKGPTYKDIFLLMIQA